MLSLLLHQIISALHCRGVYFSWLLMSHSDAQRGVTSPRLRVHPPATLLLIVSTLKTTTLIPVKVLVLVNLRFSFGKTTTECDRRAPVAGLGVA